MIYFFAHENFPVPAAELLKTFDAGNDFEIFADAYPHGTAETEWISLVGKRNPKPFILTLGNEMLRNQVERDFLRASACHFINFGRAWASAGWPTMAWKLIKCWPAVLSQASTVDRQTLLEVSINGKVFRSVL